MGGDVDVERVDDRLRVNLPYLALLLVPHPTLAAGAQHI